MNTWKGFILKPPFPYFGGKRRVTAEVWRRFGDVPNYIEPFAGSLAVLLGRPEFKGNRIETINDMDGHIANFWRALKHDPEAVAAYADWPVSELDSHARGDWLYYRPDARAWVERLRADPDYYDAKSAGWWVWFVSTWIGSLPSIPPSQNAGSGVARKRPHLADAGNGNGMSRGEFLIIYMQRLAARLERVRVCCGDWTRVTGPSVTWKHGITAVFLDPPYSHDERHDSLYSTESATAASACREWAIENGDNPQLRIALCGYDTEHAMPDTWHAHAWKTQGGYGLRSHGRGRENRFREVVWFSPHCIDPFDTLPLFATNGGLT